MIDFREGPDLTSMTGDMARDLDTIARIDAIPTLLAVACEITGMRFAAVARVDAGSWTACAVDDRIAFGLKRGDQLDLDTTLCKEVREARRAIVIDDVSQDSVYCGHPTPHLYGLRSYISVPIVLPDGEYFGNLCALDPLPARVSEARIVSTFEHFARLIATQFAAERRSELAQQALRDAHSLADLREQFIAVLGHDLRTPLSVVSVSAGTLPALSGDPRILDVAQRITRSVRRMSGLIEDVLDFARGRLGGGFRVMLREALDITPVLDEVIAEVRSAYPGRAIEVSIEPGPAIRCDPARIQQLASNLLVNAMQHGSPEHPVDFSAHQSGGCVVLTVTNQGTPIPEESIPQVFKPFWRHATAGGRQGLGLGLYICAEIARAHGGQIEVISSQEHGTTFAVRLPLG